jgi:hypothetical protein
MGKEVYLILFHVNWETRMETRVIKVKEAKTFVFISALSYFKNFSHIVLFCFVLFFHFSLEK